MRLDHDVRRAGRAVGRPDGGARGRAAVGRTPVPIIVPCHRVLGSDGSLTGYLGGMQRKQALLDLERGSSALFASSQLAVS